MNTQAKKLKVVPESRSILLRATHILSIHIDSVDAHPWGPRTQGGEERLVNLIIRIREIVKGNVDQKVDESVKFTVSQVRLGMAWGRMPGAWSNIRLEPGLGLVAFSSSNQANAAQLLTPPAVITLESTDSALADARLAARSPEMNLEEWLAQAKLQASALGNLFADFLWEAYKDEAMADFAIFSLIAAVMEWPDLGNTARSTLLMSIPDTVQGAEPPSTQCIDRLTAAMIRILALPKAEALHENLVGTFLPNLVDADNPRSRSPAVVLADYPQELALARRFAQQYGQQEDASVFTAWAKR